VATAKTTLSYQDRIAIREWYQDHEEVILNTIGWGIDKYKYEWLDAMSPIERKVWGECITAGLVMYPEYPVGEFWVDFGNPRTLVAIECDGAEFHQNSKRDAERQKRIERQFGWKVYRISGSEIYQGTKPPDDATEEQFAEWLSQPGLEQFITSIRLEHDNA